MSKQLRVWVLYTDPWQDRRGMRTCVEIPAWLSLERYRARVTEWGGWFVAIYYEKPKVKA